MGNNFRPKLSLRCEHQAAGRDERCKNKEPIIGPVVFERLVRSPHVLS